MDEALYAEVVRRLDAAGVDDDTATLVLAAFSGDLDAVLSGESPETPEPREEAPREPVGAYLSRVDVQGFRGIGPAASLELAPGPASPSSSGGTGREVVGRRGPRAAPHRRHLPVGRSHEGLARGLAEPPSAGPAVGLPDSM